MKNLINTSEINTVNVLGAYENTVGKFRSIIKCKAGWMTIVDSKESDNKYFMEYPESIISNWAPGALQTVEFQPEGYDGWLTVFARKGNKVILIDRLILANITVGIINQYFYNTNLYNHHSIS